MMSRSRKQTPVRGIILSTHSKKQDKRLYNRRFRHASEQAIRADGEPDILAHLREHSDPWAMGKDGKTRFDPHKYPELMRK